MLLVPAAPSEFCICVESFINRSVKICLIFRYIIQLRNNAVLEVLILRFLESHLQQFKLEKHFL